MLAAENDALHKRPKRLERRTVMNTCLCGVRSPSDARTTALVEAPQGEERKGGVEGGNRPRIGLPGGLLSLRRGLPGLLGRYSASAGFGDEHLIMPITVGIPRSDLSAEHDLHVKQVL